MALKGKTEALAENVKVEDQSEAVAETTTEAWEEQAEVAAEETQALVQAASPATELTAPKKTGGLMAAVGAADDGFDALDDEIGFGSFPMVKLDKSKFVIDKAEYDEFHAVILSARPKWVYKADDDHLLYSYDQVYDTSGKTIEAVKAEWKADGVSTAISVSKYMECASKVVSEGAHQGRIVLLSVAPASVKRLGGYRAELKLTGKSLGKVVTRIFPGDKVQINPKISFYPWNFELVGNYEE